MTLYYADERSSLYLGDCRAVLERFDDGHFDAVVTDPPYELGFMGRAWDASGVAFDPDTWRAILRVMKPGAHLVAFGAPRNYHRLTCAIEDAGFEIRDCLMWLFGQGFPKSLDVSKAIDKAAGAEREVAGKYVHPALGAEWANYPSVGRRSDLDGATFRGVAHHREITAPATPDAERWQGFGTALKPAYEPIVLARRPLIGTVAANVQAHGVGGLNIDGCRIEGVKETPWGRPSAARASAYGMGVPSEGSGGRDANLGRWPANVVLSEEAAALLDAEAGERVSGWRNTDKAANVTGRAIGLYRNEYTGEHYGDSGGPSRFFYTAKASRAERERGLEGDAVRRSDGREKDIENPRLRTSSRRNFHTTVKPVSLMRWLCRLVTPPGGLILDPFVGSGSTRLAALEEGFEIVGIDIDPDYLDLAAGRAAQAGFR